MKHLFAPYNIAVMAKEKGFNEPCICVYHNKAKTNLVTISGSGLKFKSEFPYNTCINSQTGKSFVTAPLYQQLVDWFMETHLILVAVEPTFSQNKDKDRTEYSLYSFTIEGADRKRRSGYKYYIYARPVNHKFESTHAQHKAFNRFIGGYYQAINVALTEAFKLI